jgi:hypothetical protein
MKRYKFLDNMIFPAMKRYNWSNFLAMKRYNQFRNLFFEAMQRYNRFTNLFLEAMQRYNRFTNLFLEAMQRYNIRRYIYDTESRRLPVSLSRGVDLIYNKLQNLISQKVIKLFEPNFQRGFLYTCTASSPNFSSLTLS